MGSLASNRATSNPINCDIFHDRFSRYFIDTTKNIDNNLKNKPDACLWKGPRSFYVFKFQHKSYTDIQYCFNPLANKHGNDTLYIDVKLPKLACPVISKALESVVSIFLENNIVSDYWKKARVIPVYKNGGEINDENNSGPYVGHWNP